MTMQLVMDARTVKVVHHPVRFKTSIQSPVTVWAQQTRNDGVVGALLAPEFTMGRPGELLIDTVVSPTLEKGSSYIITIVGQLEVSGGSGDVSDEDVSSEDITSSDFTLNGGNVREQLQQLLDEIANIASADLPDDFDIASANIVSTDTTLTLSGSSVRGQLTQLLNFATHSDDQDFEVSSANLTSTDALVTLSGSSVRGQIFQLLDHVQNLNYTDSEIESANITSADALTTLSGSNVRGQLVQLNDSRFQFELAKFEARDLELLKCAQNLIDITRGEVTVANASTNTSTHITFGNVSETLVYTWALMGGIAVPGGTPFIARSNVAGSPNGSSWTTGNVTNLTFRVSGSVWMQNISSAGDQGFAVAVGGAVSSTGSIATTQDFSSAWTARSPGSFYSGSFRGVLELDNRGCYAWGTLGEIQRSLNGTTWNRDFSSGGEFVDAARNDEGTEIVFIRSNSFVRSGSAGYTSGTLPISGALGIEFNTLLKWYVVGTDGTALWNGSSFVRIENSSPVTGTLNSFVAVATGFMACDQNKVYRCSRPWQTGSWLNVPGRGLLQVASYNLVLGANNAKTEVMLMQADNTNTKTYAWKSGPWAYY